MLQLKISSKNKITPVKIEKADSFVSRSKGLLGRTELANDNALWILRCNSIHTFFMNFAIDCVFLDSKMKVCAIYSDIKPWRLTPLIWRARSVIEMAAGQARENGIELGDTLYVGN